MASCDMPATRKIERLLYTTYFEQIVGVAAVIYWITVQEAIRFSDTIEAIRHEMMAHRVGHCQTPRVQL